MARQPLLSAPFTRTCLAVAYRRWYCLALPLILLPLGLVANSYRQAPNYRATARVVVSSSPAPDVSPRSVGRTLQMEDRELAAEAGIAASDPVHEIIVERLDLSPADEFPPAVVTPDVGANALDFSSTGSTANEAAFFANSWASAYVEMKQAEHQLAFSNALVDLEENLDQLRTMRGDIRADLVDLNHRLAQSIDEIERASVQRQIDQEASSIAEDVALIDARIDSTAQSITQLELDHDLGSAGAALVTSSAVAPDEPIGPPLARPLASGFAAGLLIGAVLALLVERLDRSIRRPEDVESVGANVLGAIPSAPSRLSAKRLAMVTDLHPRSSMADAYQKVRSALQYSILGQNPTAVVVTSPNRGDGTTTTVVNLGLALASMDLKVVLADTDFQRPQLHKIFGAPASPGISDAHVNRIPLAHIAAHHPRLAPNLAALPAGAAPPDPASYLSSTPFGLVLADLDTQCDLVVIDTPPVLPRQGEFRLSSYAGGVVLVVRAGRTSKKELLQAIATIESAGGQLLGVVVNGVRSSTRWLRPNLPTKWLKPRSRTGAASTAPGDQRPDAPSTAQTNGEVIDLTGTSKAPNGDQEHLTPTSS